MMASFHSTLAHASCSCRPAVMNPSPGSNEMKKETEIEGLPLEELLTVTTTLATAVENFVLDQHLLDSPVSASASSSVFDVDLLRQARRRSSVDEEAASSLPMDSARLKRPRAIESHDASDLRGRFPKSQRITETLSAQFALSCSTEHQPPVVSVLDLPMECSEGTPLSDSFHLNSNSKRKIKTPLSLLNRPPSLPGHRRPLTSNAQLGHAHESVPSSMLTLPISQMLEILMDMQRTMRMKPLTEFDLVQATNLLEEKQIDWTSRLLSCSQCPSHVAEERPDLVVYFHDIVPRCRSWLLQRTLTLLSQLPSFHRELLDQVLMHVTAVFEFVGLSANPLDAELRSALLNTLFPLMARYLQLQLQHYTTTVCQQSKFRIMNHYEHLLLTLKQFKLLLSPPPSSHTSSPHPHDVEDQQWKRSLLQSSSMDAFCRCTIETGLALLEHSAQQAHKDEVELHVWAPFALHFIHSLTEVVGWLARYHSRSLLVLDRFVKNETRIQAMYQTVLHRLND